MSESADINRPEPDRGDDRVIPFHLNEKQVRGRIVRLGTVADDIVSRHDVPVAVQNLLAETMALTARTRRTLVGSFASRATPSGSKPAGAAADWSLMP